MTPLRFAHDQLEKCASLREAHMADFQVKPLHPWPSVSIESKGCSSQPEPSRAARAIQSQTEPASRPGSGRGGQRRPEAARGPRPASLPCGSRQQLAPASAGPLPFQSGTARPRQSKHVPKPQSQGLHWHRPTDLGACETHQGSASAGINGSQTRAACNSKGCTDEGLDSRVEGCIWRQFCCNSTQPAPQ